MSVPRTLILLTFAAALTWGCPEAGAQWADVPEYRSAGAAGARYHVSAPTAGNTQGPAARTRSASTARELALRPASSSVMSHHLGGPNGLPATRLDSFVRQAGHHAEHIYGDEGEAGPPPYMGFSKPHRINIGIMDRRDAGITTGHGSFMPDAWGRDEFLGQEYSQSGSTGHSGAHGFSAGLPNVLENANGTPINQQLPEPPGEGYQPMYQHGVFVGWWSPEEIALAQTDFRAALRSIVWSDRYFGGESGRRSILYEIGDIPSPF